MAVSKAKRAKLKKVLKAGAKKRTGTTRSTGNGLGRGRRSY